LVRAPNSQSRAPIVVAILAAHAVLITIMATSRSAHRPEAMTEFHSLPIYLMPLVEEDLPPVSRTQEARPRIRMQPVPVPLQSTAITIAAPEQVPASTEPAGPPVDWAIAGAIAARNAGERPATVTFGKQPEEEQRKEPRGIFEKKSPREAGYIEEIAPGVTRKWMSDKCYMEFGHPPPLFAGQGPAVNPVQCVMEGEPDGVLFDHLKPKYLKKK
jgi:hypothetical protein